MNYLETTVLRQVDFNYLHFKVIHDCYPCLFVVTSIQLRTVLALQTFHICNLNELWIGAYN